MEVGAVKQAFNNEVIHLKKNLNQAKIQTIHKLTRKAKTLTERTAPEALKEKLKRKAESAVNEVLIIKKLKPRDLARFTVTHTGKLNDYLNKKEVDLNKACARLLLHKALQEKYKLIRERFGNISINDLLMSRQERKKLKKDLKDKQKEKRNAKVKKKLEKETKDKDSSDITQQSLDVEMNKDSINKTSEYDSSSVDTELSESENVSCDTPNVTFEENSNLHSFDHNFIDDKKMDVNEVGKFIRPPPDEEDNIESLHEDDSVKKNVTVKENSCPTLEPKINIKSKKSDKRKENKNKNINEKILNRNFKRTTEPPPQAVKVVDPFFVTSTGDKYLSLAEPRAPDEVKDEHRQGNRQYRRAMLFGHVPKIKPKKNNYEKYNQGNNKISNQNNPKFKQNTFNSISDREFSKKGKSFDNSNKIEEIPEKLHPSWEAKKKHSSILPFQGKKIVFDDS